MPIEHVISLEYLKYFIVLHCVLAAFCQLSLNEYCIVLYRRHEVKYAGLDNFTNIAFYLGNGTELS